MTWEKEGGETSFFFYNSVVIVGGGGGEMDGGESVSGLHQLHQLSPSPTAHCGPNGPEIAERKVRGLPAASKLRRTGAGDESEGRRERRWREARGRVGEHRGTGGPGGVVESTR